MNTDESIINSIGIIANMSAPTDNKNFVIGKSSAVKQFTDEDGTIIDYVSITPIDTSMCEISFVRLSPDNTVAPQYTPVEGSLVCVSLSDGNSGIVTQFGQTNKIQLAVSKDTNQKNYGGLIIIQDLVDKINTLEDTVNTLSNMMTTLLGDYNGHTHVSASPGSPTGVPSAIDSDTSPDQITKTKVSDIENPIVQHGNGSAANSTYQTELTTAYSAIQTQQKIVDSLQAVYDNIQHTVNANNLIKAKTTLEELQAKYNAIISKTK